MKQKFKQILYEIRRQPLISGVTFVATVLAVFLIMIVVIMQRVSVVPFSPESCRDRMLIGQYIHFTTESGGAWSGGASMMLSRKLYADLDGVENVSYIQRFTNSWIVKGSTENSFTVQSRTVDADFFKIFDHPLVSGRYFTKEEADAHLPVTVISESTARKAFGTVECVNMTLLVDYQKFTVTGVVKDNSSLATTASGDMFIPHGMEQTLNPENGIDDYFGGISTVLLVKEGVDFQSIREQVKARYAILNTELAEQGYIAVYHESPFDQETIAAGSFGSNQTPDASGARKSRYFIYAILLIVPAINLSSLLHSRMRRRVAEIGVRRAYGCTRLRVIADILWENFIITLAGGCVGVALGVIFAMTYSGLYENMNTYGSDLTPALSAVINWATIVIALCVCFILNLISASVPAWQASRINPVEAINAK